MIMTTSMISKRVKALWLRFIFEVQRGWRARKVLDAVAATFAQSADVLKNTWATVLAAERNPTCPTNISTGSGSRESRRPECPGPQSPLRRWVRP